MSRSAALPALAALLALAGCFDPSFDSCRITCNLDQDCPGDLTCLGGLCASPRVASCKQDAGSGGTDAAGAIDSGSDAGPDASGTLPPTKLCHSGPCFTLPPDIRANLVLLLWPTNLPTVVGAPVSVWSDQSGQGNDAHALYPTAPPQVIQDGVHLDPTQVGSGFIVLNSSSLDFGSGDFVVIVVAGLSSDTAPVTLFKKADGARSDSQQIALEWVLSSAYSGRPQGTVDETSILAASDTPQPSVGAYTLYRSADRVELHLNGSVLGTANLPTPGLTTTNLGDAYVGVNSMFGAPADSIEAVIAIRGSVTSYELNQLESFLKSQFMQPGP